MNDKDDNVKELDPIAALERAAREEVDEEFSDSAKRRIKAKLREIKQAEKVLANAKLEYDALVRDIRSEF